MLSTDSDGPEAPDLICGVAGAENSTGPRIRNGGAVPGPAAQLEVTPGPRSAIGVVLDGVRRMRLPFTASASWLPAKA